MTHDPATTAPAQRTSSDPAAPLYGPVSMLPELAHNLRQHVRAGPIRAQFATRDARGRFIPATAARDRWRRDRRGRFIPLPTHSNEHLKYYVN